MNYCYPLLLIVLLLCYACNNDQVTDKEAVGDEKTASLEPCNEALLKELKTTLQTATKAQLSAFLHTLTPNCAAANSQAPLLEQRHALLVRSLHLHLETVLDILASDADLEQAHILTLLKTPATQPLPQRDLVLRLRQRNSQQEVEQQVLQALEESVEKGDAQLLDVYNDKSHTYQ